MNISDCRAGDTLRLLDFGATNPQYRRRLLALGITRGVILSITRIAPLGCPIQVEVRGTMLALRKNEACDLIWERQ